MLNKQPSFKNLVGARGVKTLCLYSMSALVFTAMFSPMLSSSAVAQSAIYNTNTQGIEAQTEIRLQQMETQIRELTGRVENQIYEINSLKQQIKNLERAEVKTPETNVSENAPRVGSGQIGVPERDPSVTVNSPFDLDLKPAEIEGIKTATPGGSTDATSLYEGAYGNIKVENYEAAQQEFETFLEKYPDHVLASNARYWLGETFYVRGDYKTAAKTFAEAFQKFPDTAKSADILLKLGMSLAGMGKEKDACIALSQVEVKFPSGSGSVLKRASEEMEKLSCGA